MDYLDKPDPQTFIAHHGIKGQKWGVRRFQNADGSLTKAGKERYNEQNSSDSSDNHENQKFHLTEKQKKYCKTIAIATGVALVTYADSDFDELLLDGFFDGKSIVDLLDIIEPSLY